MNVLLFDCETTGLIENRTVKIDRQPEIIELYLGLFDLDGEKPELIFEFDKLIRPKELPLHWKITQITGIKTEDVAELDPFAAHADAVRAMIEAAPMVGAHNLIFDRDMIDIEFERLGQIIVWPQSQLCTIEQTMHLKGKRLTLSALHEELIGAPFAGAHRAKVDVEAHARCVHALLQRGEI